MVENVDFNCHSFYYCSFGEANFCILDCVWLTLNFWIAMRTKVTTVTCMNEK